MLNGIHDGKCGPCITKKGNIEIALDELKDCISRLEKLSNESIDLVCMPRPCEPCEGNSICGSNPSLGEIIRQLYNRVSYVNERIIQTNSVLSEQLGSIRLD